MATWHADGLPDVGLYVDDERSIAAVSSPSSASPSLHVASLHNTVLYVHADGSASLGGTDDPDATAYTGFVAADSDTDIDPAELIAMTLRCLLADVAASVGTEMSSLAAAATFPSSWSAERVSAVRVGMNRYGLDHVALVPESEAQAAWAGSTQATWAGSDSGVAAARGAARIATHYPVDSVTEEISTARSAHPVWTRTPVLAAAAVAAFIAVAGGVTALVLQNSSTPTIPEITGPPVAAATTSASTPTSNIPFPTVVPIIEAPPQTYQQAPAPEAPLPPPESEPAPEPSPESTPEEPPRTVPAAEQSTTTPDSAPDVKPGGDTPDASTGNSEEEPTDDADTEETGEEIVEEPEE